MKVLQLNTGKTWRGGERQTLFTMEGLRDAGVEVELLCRRGGPLEQRAREIGVRVHPVATLTEAFLFLAFFGHRYDILHCQSARVISAALSTRPFHRRKVVCTRRVNFRPKRVSGKLKYYRSDAVIAISRAIAETLEQIGVQVQEIIPSTIRKHTLDHERAERFRREQGLEGKRIVGTTGDMVPQKDPLTMVEAIHHLAELRDDVVFLHFGNTQMIDRVRPKIEEYGLQDVYRVLGHVDQVEDFFSLFDVFLLSSDHTEGLSSSVFDAFVYEVPVVSTLTGGMHDSVGDRGLTCDEGGAECLARQVDRLLNDPELGRAMTKKAARWAEETISLPVITQRYLAVYRQVLGEDR